MTGTTDVPLVWQGWDPMKMEKAKASSGGVVASSL